MESRPRLATRLRFRRCLFFSLTPYAVGTSSGDQSAASAGGFIAVVTVVLLASLLTAAVEGQGSGLFAAGDSVGSGHGRRGVLGATPYVGQRAVRMVSTPVLLILALLKEESS